jgi:hypothetical protein
MTTRRKHDGHEDEKLIGVYKTRADGKAAIARLRSQPGFRDLPKGFSLTAYELNKDHWTEGYVTVNPDGSFSD